MSLLLYTRVLVLSLWLSLVGFTASQTTHTVQVGPEGSFYNPGTISAAINDTIVFVFAGPAHSVTQGSFESPCVPLEGGFNSGITGVGTNTSAPPPIWSLTITNDTEPIWFFCQSTKPVSHCASGMVGAINPPSIPVYNQFVAAAKLVTATPSPTPSLTLSGIGAFASNSPAPATTIASSTTTITTTTSLSTSSPTSLATAPPTSTPVPDSSSESAFDAHKGGIIAGIVIGALVLIIALMILFFFLKRKRDQAAIRDFFSYSVPPPKMTSRSGSQLALGSAPTTTNTTINGVNPIRTGTGTGGGGTTGIIPNRRPNAEYDFSSGFGNRAHAYASIGLTKDPDLYGGGGGASSETGGSEDTYASTSTRTGGRALPKRPSRTKLAGDAAATTVASAAVGGEHDINTLAKEVAAVLQRQASQRAINPNSNSRGEKDGLPPGSGNGSDGGDPPPPVYRS